MEPYIGEIRMFGGNFAPAGWAFCNGALLSISENTTLFSLIGTTYGGDGQSSFALPDLRSRTSIGQGNGAGLTPRELGQAGGTETVTLTAEQMSQHRHPMNASTATAQPLSSGTVPGVPSVSNGHFYAYDDGSQPPPASANLATQSCSSAGGNQPHENLMPTLCVSYIISLYGIYPTQN